MNFAQAIIDVEQMGIQDLSRLDKVLNSMFEQGANPNEASDVQLTRPYACGVPSETGVTQLWIKFKVRMTPLMAVGYRCPRKYFTHSIAFEKAGADPYVKTDDGSPLLMVAVGLDSDQDWYRDGMRNDRKADLERYSAVFPDPQYDRRTVDYYYRQPWMWHPGGLIEAANCANIPDYYTREVVIGREAYRGYGFMHDTMVPYWRQLFESRESEVLKLKEPPYR